MKNCKELFKNITTFIFDVDGVCSDCTVLAMPDGEQLRTFSVKDGYALQLAIKMGYRIVIISGGRSEAIRKRFEYLGIRDVFLGAHKPQGNYFAPSQREIFIRGEAS